MNPPRAMPYGFDADSRKPYAYLVKKYHCSGTQIARWRTECGVPTKLNNKPVNQYTKDGKFVRQYASIYKAAIAVKGRAVNIGNCAMGRFPTSYGYVWRYAKKSED